MSDKSAIEWTDSTWNPTTGCTKVSPGCANCYIERTPAFRINGRRFERGHIPLVLHDDRVEQPLHWRKPRRVFVNSLSDLFHADVPDAFIDRVFAVMALCQQHTFQVLTKRADRMLRYCRTDDSTNADCEPDLDGEATRDALIEGVAQALYAKRNPGDDPSMWLAVHQPLPNVWLGVSVENQHFADERFPFVCELGEAGWNTMVSLEPLLGPVRIPDRYLALGRRAWCIPGGESGARARPFDLAWPRSILQQCHAAGVPCFYKQGGLANRCRHDAKGGCVQCMPTDLRIRQFPNALQER